MELQNVARTYPGPTPVDALKPVNLLIRRGELVAVTGRSGSGKSTLLHLLGLLDQPTQGTYLLEGQNTANLSDASRTKLRAARIGFVFQSFHLLAHRTAVENIMIALMYCGAPRRNRRHLAEESLERVGLGHRRNVLPNTLSGGERQRVAIARALATNPSLVLADEPTGNLDSATAEEVMALVHNLHADGQTIVVVTHDATIALGCPRRVRINDGILAEELTS